MDRVDMMRTFVAVARHGSFTHAATELDIAVQTVSKYVKALEDDLDVQLFNRTTRKVSLNNTGVAYFERCNELLDQFDEVEASVKAQHGAPKGKIRISAPTAFGELHLVPALAEFQSLYADIIIELDLSNRRVSLVDEGFDLAIRIGQLNDSAMIAKKLSNMRVSVCVSPTYLEKNGRPQHPKELVDHNCLVDVNSRVGKHWSFIENKKEFNVDVTGSFQANSPGSIRKMVAAGLGIGRCPAYVLSEDLIAGRIVTLFDNMELSHFGVYAMYPHRKHLSTRVRTLVDFLESQFIKIQ